MYQFIRDLIDYNGTGNYDQTYVYAAIILIILFIVVLVDVFYRFFMRFIPRE